MSPAIRMPSPLRSWRSSTTHGREAAVARTSVRIGELSWEHEADRLAALIERLAPDRSILVPVNPDARVAIIGLGYVGLPLALAFSEAGLDVTGVDASARRVEELHAGRSPIDDIDDARLQRGLAAGFRIVSPDEAALETADAVFVCVPTPITQAKDPDLGPVLSAAVLVREHLRAGQLVVLQSTTFPGTTAGPFRAELERSGLVAGRDFDLAFAPERVNPGDPASASKAIPRLVGGTTPAATTRAAALLRHINDNVVELSSPDAAELAKLLENVFRNVNIALVNQLALLCERMGVDVWEVIDAAATKPFGFMRFTPGPGVGGHCIPVDPYYLSWRAREFDFVDRFVELAGDINLAMPRHVVDLVAEALNDRGRALSGARVGVLGRRLQAERPGPAQLARRRDHRRPASAGCFGHLPRSARRVVPRRRRRRIGLSGPGRAPWRIGRRGRRDAPRGDRLGRRLCARRPGGRHDRQLAGSDGPSPSGPSSWGRVGRPTLTAAVPRPSERGGGPDVRYDVAPLRRRPRSGRPCFPEDHRSE